MLWNEDQLKTAGNPTLLAHTKRIRYAYLVGLEINLQAFQSKL